jgi:phosphatidate phosphatase LPIN
LPEGPVIVSPEKLMEAISREVITKNPEAFKIEALKDIISLYPKNPLYAGFGNKSNDHISYHTCGIPKYRIFIVNTSGEIKVNSIYHKNHSDVNSLVDHIFPPLIKKTKKGEDEVKKEFSSWSYWNIPIDDDETIMESNKNIEIKKVDEKILTFEKIEDDKFNNNEINGSLIL